jgi:hypothetical protein
MVHNARAIQNWVQTSQTLKRSRSILAKGDIVATLAQIFGAFIITFLLGKQALTLLGRWFGGLRLLAAAHGGTLVLAWIVTAFGAADKGAPDWTAGTIFILPSLVWFVIGLSHLRDDEEPKIAPMLYTPSETHVIRKGRDLG